MKKSDKTNISFVLIITFFYTCIIFCLVTYEDGITPLYVLMLAFAIGWTIFIVRLCIDYCQTKCMYSKKGKNKNGGFSNSE